MRYTLPRFFVTLACVPFLLSLGLSPVQAQGDVDTFPLSFTGRKQEPPTPHLDVEILPLDARKLLIQLDETQPEMSDSPLTRRCLERLQQLQTSYTRAGMLDEASVLRDSVEEFLARRAGIEPDPGNLTTFRNQVGQTHIFRVTGHRTGSVWGSQPYTDDSDLGAAAVHAGLLREGQRGTVKVTILPGQDHYDGGVANGINSSSYETWQGSYTITPVAALPGRQAGPLPEEAQKLVDELTKTEEKISAVRLWKGMDRLQAMLESAQKSERLDEALALREGLRALIIKLVGARPDPGNLNSLRDQIGKSFYFVVTGRATGSIWGSEVYTDDSDLGTVAVHVGLLQPGQKGIVQVTIRLGYEGYDGSESHGILSGSYGPWHGSYRVSAFRMPKRPSPLQ